MAQQDQTPSDDESVLTTVLDVLKLLLIIPVYLVIGIVRAVLPASLLPRKSVNGEVVLITGSGSGLGRLMAVRFAKLGARLVLWDIDEKGNLETKRLVEAENAEATAHTVDLSKKDQIYSAADKVKEEMGDVDILVNNAGIVTGKKFEESSDALCQKSMDVNALAHFWTARAFVPRMVGRNHGHVVSVASAAGLFGTAGLGDYCASKFAAVGFNEALALEMYARQLDGIKFTTVCPFFIDTGMFHGVTTRFPMLLPILEADYAADKIMDAILTDQTILMMPRIVYLVYFAKGLLPTNLGVYLSDFFGVCKSMDHFKGRN